MKPIAIFHEHPDWFRPLFAELERRMRVNDQILRYMTIRVDEDRRRADKLRDRRARKAARRTGAKNKASGAGAGANVVVADTEDAEA